MDKDNVLQALGQVQAEQAGKLFRRFLRGTARGILIEVMAEEVEALCGAAYCPSKEAKFYRAGSARGYVYMDSRRENLARPRVRQYKDDEATVKGRVGFPGLGSPTCPHPLCCLPPVDCASHG